ncbi:MAG: AGE family epimerase/isomerase [Pontixanthobacter sp.]
MKTSILEVQELHGRVRECAARADGWMRECAFPFWADRTPSPGGGFFERLDLDGVGIPGEPSRVRLQARMVFTFALAADLGWDRDRALALVNRGLEILVNDCRRPDGLYGALVVPGTGLSDDTAQTYDTAFALLAFAAAYRTFDLDLAREAGSALNRDIEALLRHDASTGGYKEQIPAPERRRQNPHMHLTEASLAWFAASGERGALERAKRCAIFVHDRFFDLNTGLLREYAGGTSDANHVEAGHHFEWVWLLDQFGDASLPQLNGWKQALHDGGMRLVRDLSYYPLSQECDLIVRDDRQRLWVPAEKLKGHIAIAGMVPSAEDLQWIVHTTEVIFADHLDQALQGAWIDVVAPDKASRITDITPATGYHVFLAFRELIAFADTLPAS